MGLGVAWADHFDAEFVRLQDQPISFGLGGIRTVMEDPFVWHNGRCYQMLVKDCDGKVTGEARSGAHAFSDDGLDWTFSIPHKAYSRRVLWDDGTETTQGCIERPFLLFEDGRPTHLFAATTDAPDGFEAATRTWNMVIPLASPDS